MHAHGHRIRNAHVPNVPPAGLQITPTVPSLSLSPPCEHNGDRAEEECRERCDSRRIGTSMQDRKTTEGPINKARPPLPLMNHTQEEKTKRKKDNIGRV